MSESHRPLSPYVGLDPYMEEDADFFFGREAERDLIIDHLRSSRLTLFYGTSGVGKSSVLHAGAAHQLRDIARQHLEEYGSPEFAVVTFSDWRDDPLPGLARSIHKWVAAALQMKSVEAVPESRDLSRVIRAWTDRYGIELLFVLDQFEEYFQYRPQEEGAGTFAAEFPRALNDLSLPARFLISLREDMISKLDCFQGIIPNLFDNMLRLSHLSSEAARKAIVEPVKEYNRRQVKLEEKFEIKPELVDEVINQFMRSDEHSSDKRPGRTPDGRGAGIEAPYLQLVMTHMWNEEKRAGSHMLGLDTLRHLGDVKSIVQKHLDTVIGALSPDKQKAIESISQFLVSPAGSKIAYPVLDLVGSVGLEETQLISVLEELSSRDARILRQVGPAPNYPPEPRYQRYEIFHDVLAQAILNWRAQYVKDQAEVQIREQRVKEQAKDAERLRWLAHKSTERELIARVEAAGPQELAEIMARPSPEEERALRTHLGDARFARMRERVLQSGLTRAGRPTQGNVVVLHGLMGGELTDYATDAYPDPIWLRIFRLFFGQFARLRVDDAGSSVSRIQAAGILKRYYGELLLSLMQHWNAHAFWYDWRVDINASADQLAMKIYEWFGDREPVHLVAHSMGGLVARAFIKKYPERWQSMWDSPGDGRRVGRLVMLGTPNHGSFSIPQLLLGLHDTLQKLALVDQRHNVQELLSIVKTFVGTYQMLPSPLVPGMADMQKLYEASTYEPLALLPSRFALARDFHAGLAPVVDADRMFYIAGYNQATYSGVRDWGKLRSMEGYEVSKRGDGTVPHRLGLLQAADGRPVPTFYIDEEHGALPGNQTVMAAIDDLLQTGTTSRLTRQLPTGLHGEEDEAIKQAARAELMARRETEEARLRELVAFLRVVVKARGDSIEEPPLVYESEREAANLLSRGFISAPQEPVVGTPIPKIMIRLLKAALQDVGQPGTDGELPVDALAVGHYIGIKPVAGEKALDQAISQNLRGKVGTTNVALEDADLLLTQFTERGIIRGELGQPFFLNDPRTRDDGHRGPDRLIAIAGMGYPGRFGIPELTVLARELCWALGQLGKRHLATVLIGSGNGNLSAREAVIAWLEGIQRALSSSAEDARRHLEVITFVEPQPARLLRIWRTLEAAAASVQPEWTVELMPPTPQEIAQLQMEAAEEDRRRRDAADELAEDRLTSDIPTRLAVELDGELYRFSALTETASVPERGIPLDPDLVNEANAELAAQREKGRQGEVGAFLEQLLFPEDLKQLLSSNAPLVLTCDATVARIHWEMVAQPELRTAAGVADQTNRTFLGIHRGFTRQLRTAFAPAPEPPPLPNRVLRVLIIGDPAADNPLPGAQEEALLVLELFKKFAEQEHGKKVRGVEVVALLGPSQATRTRVMQELILKPFDVLHYAGHCLYDPQRPSASGWLFTGGKRLSATELNRIDRIPKFIFANACEAGITPDRAEQRSPELAPSFAESFFARGVQNFVCTAWPVNDLAARDFARRFYTGLLGLQGHEVEPMHVAMREARIDIFTKAYGVRTWGAYQHYGNPYFRLLR